MDIRILKTGRAYYRVDPTVGAMLCEAGLAERVVPAPPPEPPAPTWSVHETEGTGELYLRVACERCKSEIKFRGKPEQIPWLETQLCVHIDPCPPAVVARYAAAKNSPVDPDLIAEARERERNRLDAAMRDNGRRTAAEMQA